MALLLVGLGLAVAGVLAFRESRAQGLVELAYLVLALSGLMALVFLVLALVQVS